MKFFNEIELIRKLFIVLVTQITIFKVINEKNYFSRNKIFGYILLILLVPIVEIINYKTDFFCSTVTLIFFMSFISSSITQKKLGYNLFLVIVSLAFNYLIYFFALIIMFMIKKVFLYSSSDMMNLVIIIIIDSIILFSIFNLKRFKYGIISLQNNLNNEYIELLILTISVGILFIGIIFSNKIIVSINNYFCIFIILGILMLITIQKSLQLYYKQQMLIKDLKETKEELEKKNRKYIQLQVSDIPKASLILERQFHVTDYAVQDEHNLRLYDTALDMAAINKALVVQDVAVISSQICNDTLEDYFKQITGGAGIA